jgi:hypothetical protein
MLDTTEVSAAVTTTPISSPECSKWWVYFDRCALPFGQYGRDLEVVKEEGPRHRTDRVWRASEFAGI